MAIKISAIVTTYNRKYEVRRALESIYAQTRMPDEIILVDDASGDDTESYIGSFSFPKLKYIKNRERKGPGTARNIGIREAFGDYVAFLDSDNEWQKEKLELFEREITSNACAESPGIICSRYWMHFQFERWEWPVFMNGLPLEQEILFHSIADASASLYKREWLVEIGMFSEELYTNLDWELLLRAVKRKKLTQMKKIDQILSENHTMYDSLEKNTDLKKEDSVKLFMEYNDQILEAGCGEAYYEEYMRAHAGEDSEAGIVNELLKNSGYASGWVQLIYEYHRKREKTYAEAAARKGSFYALLSKWLQLKLDGSSVADKLSERGIKTVAIYGAGKHGKFLYQDLVNSKIQVMYFIDRRKEAASDFQIPIYSIDETLPPVDMVVTTPYMEIAAIREALKAKGTDQVIGLDELLQ